jgi:hypothetical protein
MSVRTESIESDCLFVANVSCNDISSNEGIENVFDDLNIALAKIQESIGDPQYWRFLIVLVAEGVPATRGEFDPYDGGKYNLGSRNPWEAFCPSFWTNAGKNPQFRRRIIEWIGRLEETLRLAETRELSTESLWEDDQTQFGEPLVTHLALVDVYFVPFYTRLLRLWDLSHEVEQGGAVIEMVNRHGITPETKELILCYTEVTGSDELGLLDLLDHAKSQ